jgi:hypothetical protein
MFSIDDRNKVYDYVLRLAHTDTRVVAGAVVGSLALGPGDRWSDLDLTFSVRDDVPLSEVLEDWTINITETFKAVQLFDLTSGTSIYRVFLVMDCLQFDLSFTPASSFGARGPKFRLLFGESTRLPFPQPPSMRELFGYAVHHILRARFCIERGRYWQAEYWISSARDYALNLACLRRGLSPHQGRGFDELPGEIHRVFNDTFVVSLERDKLLKALRQVIEGLLYEVDGVEELAGRVAPHLHSLMAE